MVIVFFFLYLFFPYYSHPSQQTLENVILDFPKNMIKPPLILLMYLTLKVNFQISLGLRKTNVCVPTTFYINGLILTQFSPLDIKYKKLNLMQKTSGNVFLGLLGEFFIFSLGCTQSWGCTLIPLRIFLDHVTIFSSSLSNI